VTVLKVLLVDDDELIRESLALTLSFEDDIEIVGEAEDGVFAVTMCDALNPDVILMDIRMPKMDGIAATGLIKKKYSNIKIMMLTTFDDKANIQQALASGADGYLLKTDETNQIADKLRVLFNGSGIIDHSLLRHFARPANPLLEKLSPREKEITELVAQGMTNKEIAAKLFLSEGTIRNKVLTIMEKLEVGNRTQLSVVFYENNT